MSANTPAPHSPDDSKPLQPVTASDRSFIATWMFSWLLGFLAIDRFYLGKIGTGILKLVTIGGFGIWWLNRPDTDSRWRTT